MKKRTFLTTLIAILLLAAVIAAGLHAVFTVAYIQASFSTCTPEGERAAQQLKEELNTYLGSSTTFLDLEQVRANYLRLAEEFGFHVVDASRGMDEVFSDVMSIIDKVV